MTFTPKFLTLDIIKEHLRIDENFEDNILLMYACSAENAALNFMQRTIESIYEEYGSIPEEIIQACLCRVGTSVKIREDINAQNFYHVPYMWECLLMPFIPEDKI